MMDCERYGANVFEVIDLINRDYPRGGMRAAGPHRRHLPAQGLRVLRGALERARACCSPSRACNESRAAVPRRGHQAPARASLRGRKVAVLGLAFKARHRRRARLALAQAGPPARARAGRRRGPRPARRRRRRSRFEEAVAGADAVVVATNHTRVLDAARRCARSPSAPAPTASSSTRGTRFGAAPGLRLRRRGRARSPPSAAPHEPRPRHRRRRHDRRRGRAAPARATPTSRCASPTSARRRSGCARAARSTPATCATLERGAQGDRAAARTSSTSPRSSAASRNFHKLPHTLTEVNNALYNARRPRRAGRTTSSASSTCRPRWSSSARREYPTTEDAPPRLPDRRSRPTASPSSPARSTAAPPTTSTACRTRSAARSTPTARARCPRTSRASRTWSPT